VLAAGATFVVDVRGETWTSTWAEFSDYQGGNAMWPTMAAWLGAAMIAGLAVVFMLGRSLRTGIALCLAATLLGFAGVPLAGQGASVIYWGQWENHVWFADPTREWQLVLLWLLPAAALVTAAVLAFIDYRATRGPHTPVPPDSPKLGNEALHWPGSTIAGVDAHSDARERL
jgi:hypothetical protein